MPVDCLLLSFLHILISIKSIVLARKQGTFIVWYFPPLEFFMIVLIKVLLLPAYICYVHPHVESHIANSFPNPSTQSFLNVGIIFALSYFVVSVGY